jgi:hypothetical protein
MMRILDFIKEKKDQFRQRQDERDAKQLQKMRKQRLKEEGRARIIKLKDKERKKIKKAREVQMNDLKRRFGAPNILKNSKAVPKKESKLGNGFGQGINPAFSIGKKK